MKKLLATVTTVVLALAMVALPSVAATATPPDDLLCTDITDGSYSAKVDVSANDPVTVSIPAGYTLVAYCVKAGTEPIIIDSNDDAPGDGTLPFDGPGNFVIDHPNKDSVSHYQLKLVPIVVVDVCDNIEGNQATVPDGMVLSTNGTSCETPPPPTDVCDNIDGDQSEVPQGMVLAENGTSCETPPGDECNDLTGARGFSISVDLDCLKVEVSGSATHQTCEASGDESVGTFVDGSILVTVSDLDGVTKIEYKKDGGSLVDVPLNDLNIDDLGPGSYEFFVTVADGYEAVDNFTVVVKQTQDPECKKQTICHWNEGGKGELGSYVEIDVSIKSIINVPNGHEYHEFDIIPPFAYYEGDKELFFLGLNYDPEAEGCGDYQFPTEGPVIPEVLFTPATCDTDGSYTLTAPPLTEGVPADVVTFFVNNVETAPGTYPVEVGEVITVKVVANYEEFPLDLSLPGGFVPEYTYPAYEFTAPTACDLTTLALTGSYDTTTPALALTAFLGLLGLAMVRSGIRVNRLRQEA